MTFDEPLLSHSAQEIDNLNPDIIYEGTKKLDPLDNKEERLEIVSKMDDVTSTGTKIPGSSKVIVYYKEVDFVVKTIPNDRDIYNRFAPILSYGKFPNKELNSEEEDAWIQSVKDQIIGFVNSIGRSLSSDTKEEIIEVLKGLAQKKRSQKLIKLLKENILIYGVVVIVPLTLGWLVQAHIAQMIQLQPLLQQNPQHLLTVPLQELLQKVVWLLAILMSISNVVMIFILRLPINSLVNGYKRKKR